MTERIVHTETHSKSDTNFTVNVINEDGKLYGQWVCECGDTGGSSGQHTNNVDAVESAVFNYSGHHSFNHAKPK